MVGAAGGRRVKWKKDRSCSRSFFCALSDCYQITGDGIVDDAGQDGLAADGPEGGFVAVELCAIAPDIMFAGGGEYHLIVAWAGLVVHDDVPVGRFPYEIHVAVDEVS